jgi:DNA-directed RNA polymerase subunit RPC12/RpoP
MIYPVSCDYCGSTHLRRSRRQSKFELIKMAIGTYPFRCLDCSGRFSVNVLLVSRLALAKCPRCLGADLTNWSRNRYHVSLGKKVMLTFGGRPYRCAACRYNFVSFRPLAARHADKEVVEDRETTVPATDVAIRNESKVKRKSAAN